MKPIFRAGLAVALATPWLAHADTASDVQALRQELDAMRAQYEARIQALETKLQQQQAASAPQGVAPAGAATAAQAATPAPSSGNAAGGLKPPAQAGATPLPAPVAAAPAAPAAPVAAAPAAPPARATATAALPAPPTNASAASGTGFNPALSLILSGLYTNASQDPSTYRIRGFPLPPNAEIGPGTRGFSLAESELGLAANIDPYFSGWAAIAFAPDNTVSVEEAYIQTTSLGNGLTLKAGRFFAGIGYLNPQHSHTWDFVDAPLAYQAMLGTQFADDGVEAAWLAPTDQFIEVRGAVGRGRSYPGSDSSRNGAGSASLAVHTGGDVGDSSSWRAGLSVLQAKADDQALQTFDITGSPLASSFTGRTRVWVADAVWKWAPGGNAVRQNFKLQGEYLHANRDGTLVADPAGVASIGDYNANQSGWYLQAVYQFMPRWRVGLRTERLSPGAPEYGANTGLLLAEGGNPSKQSLMVDYSPSEFSRIRLQLAQDRARPGSADNQVFLQYQMSLGAHGAHTY